MLQVQTSIFLDVPERLGKFIVAPSFTAHIINIRIIFQQGACMVRFDDFFRVQVQKWDEQRAAGNFAGPL
jgi:hypothetical protein